MNNTFINMSPPPHLPTSQPLEPNPTPEHHVWHRSRRVLSLFWPIHFSHQSGSLSCSECDEHDCGSIEDTVEPFRLKCPHQSPDYGSKREVKFLSWNRTLSCMSKHNSNTELMEKQGKDCLHDEHRLHKGRNQIENVVCRNYSMSSSELLHSRYQTRLSIIQINYVYCNWLTYLKKSCYPTDCSTAGHFMLLFQIGYPSVALWQKKNHDYTDFYH